VSLLSLLLTIAAIGLVVWLLNRFVPMPAPIPNILVAIAVIVCLVLALSAFGVLDDIQDVQVPRVGS
jgi:hypothetical protein